MHESACSIREEKKNTASVPFAKSLRIIYNLLWHEFNRNKKQSERWKSKVVINIERLW